MSTLAHFSCGFAVSMLLLSSSGCGLSQGGHSQHSKPKAKLEYDVITVPELAKQEILKTPSTFVLDYYENIYAWDRAKVFFKQHTTSFLGERKISENKFMLSNIESSKDRYAFEVERTKVPEGFKYQVTCFSNELKGEDLSDLNARNLARFIKSGELERGYLE